MFGETTSYFQPLVEVKYAAQQYHQILQLDHLHKIIEHVRYYNKKHCVKKILRREMIRRKGKEIDQTIATKVKYILACALQSCRLLF